MGLVRLFYPFVWGRMTWLTRRQFVSLLDGYVALIMCELLMDRIFWPGGYRSEVGFVSILFLFVPGRMTWLIRMYFGWMRRGRGIETRFVWWPGLWPNTTGFACALLAFPITKPDPNRMHFAFWRQSQRNRLLFFGRMTCLIRKRFVLSVDFGGALSMREILIGVRFLCDYYNET